MEQLSVKFCVKACVATQICSAFSAGTSVRGKRPEASTLNCSSVCASAGPRNLDAERLIPDCGSRARRSDRFARALEQRRAVPNRPFERCNFLSGGGALAEQVFDTIFRNDR